MNFFETFWFRLFCFFGNQYSETGPRREMSSHQHCHRIQLAKMWSSIRSECLKVPGMWRIAKLNVLVKIVAFITKNSRYQKLKCPNQGTPERNRPH